ncbi:MAG: manganese efflux pump MntP family protein [Pseudobutyrivibrio sp.]|nr:manganese efflux pump MntP family protein [Pseudobutyrivibrio sp.]
MSVVENLFIIAGILLDVFATMEIQGAMMAQIKKKTMVIACVVVAVVELIFYFTGYAICWLLASRGHIVNPTYYGEAVAAIVLALLGVRLMFKAISREYILERRKDSIKVWDYIRFIVMSSIYTAAAGCACGLVGITIWQVILIILVVSFVMVILGLYTGLHYGFEIKTVAYFVGALLLWGVSLEMLLHRILEII